MIESSDINTKTEQSTYTQVQLIGYHMYTEKPFTTGFDAYPPLDVQMRMRRIFDVMKFCAGKLGNDQPGTLKIFVAPEFYGRSPLGNSDGTGHYDPGTVWKGFEVLRELCRQEKGFQHWLVVPGTFVTAETIHTQPVTQAATFAVVFNSVYAFTGDGSQFRIIHKKDFSEVDELTALRGGNRQYKQLSEVSRGTPTKQSTPIQVGNLTIGIEICRDHDLKRLRMSLKKKKNISLSSPLPASDGVNVHVLPVCGIPAQNNAIATIYGGYVFRVDGHTDARCVPTIEYFPVLWPTPTMGDDLNTKNAGDPISAGTLPQELQLRSDYLSDQTKCSTYLISPPMQVK